MNKDEQEAIEWVSSSAMTALTGFGIPGVIGTGTFLALKDFYIRDTFTLWLFWIEAAVFAVSALTGIACRVSLRLSVARRFTYGLAITSIVALILGLVIGTILTMRKYV